MHAHFKGFAEARSLVHALRLPNGVEYHKWARGSSRLEDIPVNPNLVYCDCGWQGWVDWLGPSFRSRKKPFASYEAAKVLVHALNFSTKEDFDKWVSSSERAAQIPACPNLTYKHSGWTDWRDFLGYEGRMRGRGSNRFLPLQEARAWVHAQKLASLGAWRQMRKQGLLPDNIPTSPSTYYKHSGWVSWEDWVGCLRRKDQWQSYEEARKYVHSLNFRSAPAYKKWAMTPERPENVPAAPHSVYRERGWISWYDWLGPGKNQVVQRYLPFSEAQSFVQEQGLTGVSDWREWCEEKLKPKNIPTNPSSYYQNQGWSSWQDFLGSSEQLCREGSRQGRWLSFEEARMFAQSLKLWSIKAWHEWYVTSTQPHDVPEHPNYVYRHEGWAGWRDFLGKIAPSNIKSDHASLPSKWRHFAEARAYVRNLSLTNAADWKQWADSSEKPVDIPKTPAYAYRDRGWNGMSDWLGSGVHHGKPGKSDSCATDKVQLSLDDLS